MKPTFKIYPRVRSIKQNGEVPFYIRVTINRKCKWFSLNLSFPFPEVIKFFEKIENQGKQFTGNISHWDDKKFQVKSFQHVDAKQLDHVNQKLETLHATTKLIISNYNGAPKPFTFDVFETECLKPGAKINTNSFYEFSENEIAHMKQMKSPPDTVRTFYSLISKLKQYKDPLFFDDITLDFLRKYHAYMINKLENKENTCSKTFRFMRNMINRAILQKIVSENIFSRFTIKTEAGHRESLTAKELGDLEKLLVKGTGKKHLDTVLKYFLFDCYTGLRFQDLKKLRFMDLKKVTEKGSEIFMIKIIMHKTGDIVSIPLLDKAHALIGETGFMNQPVFKVYGNQVTNRHLKDIISLAKINKTITFHCARHTFANHCLNKDLPMELVRDLLGHKNIKTTMIYASYTDSKKIQYIRSLQERKVL